MLETNVQSLNERLSFRFKFGPGNWWLLDGILWISSHVQLFLRRHLALRSVFVLCSAHEQGENQSKRRDVQSQFGGLVSIWVRRFHGQRWTFVKDKPIHWDWCTSGGRHCQLSRLIVLGYLEAAADFVHCHADRADADLPNVCRSIAWIVSRTISSDGSMDRLWILDIFKCHVFLFTSGRTVCRTSNRKLPPNDLWTHHHCARIFVSRAKSVVTVPDTIVTDHVVWSAVAWTRSGCHFCAHLSIADRLFVRVWLRRCQRNTRQTGSAGSSSTFGWVRLSTRLCGRSEC